MKMHNTTKLKMYDVIKMKMYNRVCMRHQDEQRMSTNNII